MPVLTLNVNASLSPIVENGIKKWSLVANTSTLDSSYVRSVTADFTYSSPYLPQNIANYIGTNIVPALPANLTMLSDGSLVPAYETTITNVTPTKIRVTTSLKYYANAVSYGKRYKYPGILAVKFTTTHPNVLCLSPLGEISNVSATYDMTKTSWQAAPSGSYAITYTNTQYRLEAPTVACPQIDSISFTPKNIRAGVEDVLTIRAFQGGKACTGYWGNLKGNIRFRNANEPYRNGSDNYVPKIDSFDIMVWNDSVVKVKVPSLYVLDVPSQKGCAGSGLVYIGRPNEATLPATQKLHIEYSAINRRSTIDTTKKVRCLLVNQGCSNQYKLRCNAGMPIEQQRATFAAARAWNRKLGYAVFQINETPVTYNWKADECIVRYVDTISPSAIMDTGHKNQNSTNINNYNINSGFDIRVMKKYMMNDGVVLTNIWQTDTAVWVINGADTTFQWAAPMDTINYTQVPKVGGGYWYNYKQDFYVAMLHELGHGLGLNHSIDAYHTNPYNDIEIMYYAICQSGDAAMRQSLTAHGGETLKGARRILNDSKNIAWNSSSYGTFTKPVAALTLAKVPANRNICGYGASKNAKVTLSTVPTISMAGASYSWSYASGGSYIGNGNTFTGQSTNTLTVKNNDPSIISNINVNGITVYCTTSLNSYTTSSDTFLFKAAANVVLQPTPSRCLNGSLQWVLPKPVPVGGTFTAYNMTAPNTAITNVVDSLYIMDRTKFTAASTYKILYKSNNNGVCPITKESTYMTTFTNCNTLSNTVHKVCINEVSRDLTAYRNGGTNDPCNDMALYFTALGSFNAGDKLIVKLSDANGAIDTLAANIAQRVIGTYNFGTAVNASITGKNDSIKLSNIKPLITTAGTNYRMRIYLKRVGTPTLIEWGDSSPEPLSFIVSTLCSATEPPCNGCGSRLAAPHTTKSVLLYPNPANDQFILAMPPYENPTNIIITDMQGRVIDIHQTTDTLHEINTSDYAAGMYFVQVQQGTTKQVLKLVIAR